MSIERQGVALWCNGVSKTFGESVVARDLDLEVQQGEICALLGPSGCGKTTTLRLIAGFEHPDTGTITIGGRVVARAGEGRAISVPPERRRVGMVFQDYALFPHLSVRDNVSFGLDRVHRAAADDMLSLVGLDSCAARMPAQVSGGQQQRVALARALAPRPDVLLLDEPFSNLDAGMRSRVRGEVRNILRAADATAVLVTHDQEEAFMMADLVAIMLGGHIVQVGRPEDVYLRPHNVAVADFLGGVQYLPGRADGSHAECVLGSVALFVPASGAVKVMVRPEAVRIVPEIGDGAPGVVRERQFLGQSVLLAVALESGDLLNVRIDPYQAPAQGERIGVTLQGPVHVFPG